MTCSTLQTVFSAPAGAQGRRKGQSRGPKPGRKLSASQTCWRSANATGSQLLAHSLGVPFPSQPLPGLFRPSALLPSATARADVAERTGRGQVVGDARDRLPGGRRQRPGWGLRGAAAGGAQSGAEERGGRSAGSEVVQTWTAASKVGGGKLLAAAGSLGVTSGRPRPGTPRWPSLGATHERGAGKGAASLER